MFFSRWKFNLPYRLDSNQMKNEEQKDRKAIWEDRKYRETFFPWHWQSQKGTEKVTRETVCTWIYMPAHTYPCNMVQPVLGLHIFGPWLHFGSCWSDRHKKKVLFIQSLQLQYIGYERSIIAWWKPDPEKQGSYSLWSPFNPMAAACPNVFEYLPLNNLKDTQEAYSWGTYLNEIFKIS